jgi:hypothetical protein
MSQNWHKKRTAPFGAAQPSTMKKSYLSLLIIEQNQDKKVLSSLKKNQIFLNDALWSVKKRKNRSPKKAVLCIVQVVLSPS